MIQQPGQSTELAVLPPYAPEPFAPMGEEAPPSPMAAANRILRGRWHWAVGLGLVLAGAGVVAGYKTPTLMFKSVGIFNVAPVVPRLVFKIEENGALSNYDAYVESQTSVVTSRRVVDMAMNSPEWQAVGRGLSDDDIAQFQKSLACSHPAKTQLLQVTFTDENPYAAKVAVNQVVDAYMKLVEERENQRDLSTVRMLTDKRNVAMSKLAELRGDRMSVTDNLGEAAIQTQYKNAIMQREKLRTNLQDLDLEIVEIKSAREADPTGTVRVQSVEELAAGDSVLEALLAQRVRAEAAIQRLIDEQVGEKWPQRIAAKQDLEDVEGQINHRVQRLRIKSGAAPDTTVDVLKDKMALRQRYDKLCGDAEEEVKRLSGTLAKIADIDADEAFRKEELELINRRLRELNMESEVHSRTTVVSRGDRPVRPDGDKRTSYAVLGGVGGMAAGFLLVLLWGARHASVRHIVDMNKEVSRGRFLGVFPELPDPAVAEAKGLPVTPEINDHCLHHVRAMLQLRNEGARRVVVMTSASPGAGKTTLGLALGMSFAATGSRTLLVDCDLVGHGLTSAARSMLDDATRRALDGENGAPAVRKSLTSHVVGARRSPSDHARSAQILAEARERASAGDPAFVEVVRRLELLARRDEAIVNGTAPRGQGRGIIAALNGARLDDCLVQFDGPNLTLLPAGDASLTDAQALSMRGLHDLLATCSERYDVVLVDTGPVLGSIEAVLVSAAADQVVMVVPRGESQTVVDEALERLERIGADVAGVVFNRALTADAAQSSYSSRSVSVSVEAA